MTREEARLVDRTIDGMCNDEAHLRYVLYEYAGGKTVQRRNPYDDEPEWVDDNDPDFDSANYEYRIKPEPKYRPFANLDECWAEMLKHQPFGWVKDDDEYCLVSSIFDTDRDGNGIQCVGMSPEPYEYLYDCYAFADGTPFGIKEGGEE